MEIKYINPDENTDSLSSKFFGAENSHTFKQRNLKETRDFGREFEMTPKAGRYPRPTTWHCTALLAVAMFTLSLLVVTGEARGTSEAGTPKSLLQYRSRAGRARLAGDEAKETLQRVSKYGPEQLVVAQLQ